MLSSNAIESRRAPTAADTKSDSPADLGCDEVFLSSLRLKGKCPLWPFTVQLSITRNYLSLEELSLKCCPWRGAPAVMRFLFSTLTMRFGTNLLWRGRSHCQGWGEASRLELRGIWNRQDLFPWSFSPLKSEADVFFSCTFILARSECFFFHTVV